MKEICVGVCCEDTRYGRKLMEYLNHQKEFPMTAWFFADEEALWKKEEEGVFQSLVLSEGIEDHGREPVCRLGEECASAAVIASEIYEGLKVRKKEECLVYGVYSPFGGQVFYKICPGTCRKKIHGLSGNAALSSISVQ